MSYDHWQSDRGWSNRYAPRLLTFRRRARLSVVDCAISAGLDPQVYLRLEAGTEPLTASNAARLATVFNLPVSQFFDPD